MKRALIDRVKAREMDRELRDEPWEHTDEPEPEPTWRPDNAPHPDK